MKKKHLILSGVIVLFLGIILVNSGLAREYKGVTFPDAETIGGAACKLNGIGLRKKLIINVYLGALYLEKPSATAAEVISSDQVKRVVLHFIYNNVSPNDLVNAWNEGFEKNAPAQKAALQYRINTFNGYFTEPVKSGEKIIITYIPGQGTEVSIKGKVKGVIQGKDFMEGLFSIWFGKNPPTEGLKKGMLGE
ncbi:MAG: chalcone isomerase family protein [Candidatus Latescibacter sp.]|nr:chalcone isomerase family protein [Candidatus Latescibacter sp.]